jgi:hypothetical protein
MAITRTRPIVASTRAAWSMSSSKSANAITGAFNPAQTPAAAHRRTR